MAAKKIKGQKNEVYLRSGKDRYHVVPVSLTLYSRTVRHLLLGHLTIRVRGELGGLEGGAASAAAVVSFFPILIFVMSQKALCRSAEKSKIMVRRVKMVVHKKARAPHGPRCQCV